MLGMEFERGLFYGPSQPGGGLLELVPDNFDLVVLWALLLVPSVSRLLWVHRTRLHSCGPLHSAALISHCVRRPGFNFLLLDCPVLRWYWRGFFRRIRLGLSLLALRLCCRDDRPALLD